MIPPPQLAAIVLCLVLGVVGLALLGRLLRPYLIARVAGVRVSIYDFIGMLLRRTDAQAVLMGLVRLEKAGVPVSLRDVEILHLAGGDVNAAVGAMLEAGRVGMEIEWDQVAAAELAGADALEVTQAVAMARESGLDLPWNEAVLMATGPGRASGAVLGRLKAAGLVEPSATVQEWARGFEMRKRTAGG